MEYTFREQDGMVQVCLNFSGPLKNDSYVELEITLIPNGADGKYICTQTLVESRKVIKQYKWQTTQQHLRQPIFPFSRKNELAQVGF